ncbi:nickel pincer cofactor biosynthesis protein LarC [Butyrivibrio proteoclasticus]|uniref:nickel pincer cofactor biosynthesis protein LarC n=1 Tax=Butyrivibrio proteoclasticus TaxID=43305 RepID=UPI00047EF072|nr:nickel pincer cofactor biosynthesis protein LarC [Butyrivibrio proteoclasticus]
MRTLFIECKMGVAGDMLTAALLGLFEDPDKMVRELNGLGVPKVTYVLEESRKCGIAGNHVRVLVDGKEEGELWEDHGEHEHEHEHSHDHGHSEHSSANSEHDHNHDHSLNFLHDIEDIIENLNVSKDIKSDVREVYQLLAEAESKAHNEEISMIHFHEVGEMDAIADVLAVCYLIHELDPDKIIVSPINYGGGSAKCAHGILPVPTPATALLLNGIPSYGSDTIKTELCTPTGAALVKYFAFEFSNQPQMVVNKIGYGMGKKDFPQANCVRALWGEAQDSSEQIVELNCNVDDMTAEEIGYAMEALFAEGALEVFTTAVGMKKSRPGTLITCICKLDKRDQIIEKIFANTTTLGIREVVSNRYVLDREIKKLDTPYGEVRVKRSFGYNVERTKYEYEDLAGIARRTGKSLQEIKEELKD